MATNVELIQVQVSADLARRLRPYRHELPRILEQGLRDLEEAQETVAELVPDEVALQKRIILSLRQAGAAGPDPKDTVAYLSADENQNWRPIQAGGAPASEMIVEERASYPWET